MKTACYCYTHLITEMNINWNKHKPNENHHREQTNIPKIGIWVVNTIKIIYKNKNNNNTALFENQMKIIIENN